MVIPPLNWCFSPSPPGQLLTPKEESWRRWRLPGGSWWQRSVPQSLDEKIQIKFKDLKKTKTLMSPAWNAWGKLLIAYKATKAQSKGKRTKKHTKRIKQKTYCGNYLPIQFFWSPLNPQSVTPQKVDSENPVALAPAHQANSLAFALAILALHLGRQQSVHSGVENVDKLISTSLPWKPGRNPELL